MTSGVGSGKGHSQFALARLTNEVSATAENNSAKLSVSANAVLFMRPQLYVCVS